MAPLRIDPVRLSIPAFPSLRTLCSIAERAAEHHQEADHAEDQRGREGEHHEEQPGDEPHHGPLDDAGRVAVEGRVGDLLHQLRVGGRQVLLDLPQDPLFVLGKRHRSQFRSRAPKRADSRRGAHCIVAHDPFPLNASDASDLPPEGYAPNRAPRHQLRSGPAPRRPTAPAPLGVRRGRAPVPGRSGGASPPKRVPWSWSAPASDLAAAEGASRGTSCCPEIPSRRTPPGDVDRVRAAPARPRRRSRPDRWARPGCATG